MTFYKYIKKNIILISIVLIIILISIVLIVLLSTSIEGFESIHSFDIYDTILARNVNNPTDIFDIIENTFPYKNFKKIRIESEKNSKNTFDSIYEEFQKITNEPSETIEKLKEFEINTEINNSYLIYPIYNLISDGDILISDMYYSNEQLYNILNSCGFTKNVSIYSSSSTNKSKNDGTIYDFLLKQYSINKHIGDNIHSDYNKALEYNINAEITDISKMNETEIFFINNGYNTFALFLRKFRLQNPYTIYSHNYNLYNDQIYYNIPILIMISAQLNKIMQNENRNTLLCCTRDGCLLEHIFKTLYPQYTCVKFHTSRKIYKNYNEAYKIYIKNTYNDNNCIIFDGNGSFKSGRKIFLEVFGYLPRVHLFSFNHTETKYDKLTYNIDSNINSNGHLFEAYNIDTIGTLLEMNSKNFIRDKINEYDINDAVIYKKTIQKFCNYFKNSKNSINNIPDNSLIIDFHNLTNKKNSMNGQISD